MKIKKVTTLPKCDFCDKNAKYDAPTMHGGRWANMCEEHCLEHGKNISIGTEFQKRQAVPKTDKDGHKEESFKIVLGTEDTSIEHLESVLFGSEDREIECPQCGDFRTVEPDATYTYVCEGCGVKVKCPCPAF